MAYDFHEALLLVDFSLHVCEAAFLVLDVAQGATEEQDFRVFDGGSHPTIRNVFLEHHTVDVLTLLLVVMLDGDNLDERVEVD